MATWNEVKSNPVFADATPEKQQAIRDDYFERVIAPKAQQMGKDVEVIRQDFYTQSGVGAPVSQPAAFEQGGEPTRTGVNAAQPGEAFYEADADGMPQVPVIGAKPLTSTVYPNGAPEGAQEAPQALRAPTGNIDTSYKPITLGERVSAWWNEEELRDPGVNPYEGMTAGEIAVKHGVMDTPTDAVKKPMGEQASIDAASTGYDSTRFVEEAADEIQRQYPSMSRQKALAQAQLEYNQGALTTVGTALTLPLQGTVRGLATTAYGIGALGRSLAEDIDVGRGEEGTERGAASRIIDSTTAGIKDAALTYLGGKMIDSLGWAATKTGEKLTGIGPKSVERINKAGARTKEAEDKFEKALDEGFEDISVKADELIQDRIDLGAKFQAEVDAKRMSPAQAKAQLDELLPLDEWRAPYQRELDARVESGALKPAEARKLLEDSTMDDYIEAANRAENSRLYKGIMEVDIPGVQGVSASDIITARRKADFIAETPGLKSGTKSVSDQIQSPGLARELYDAALPREVDSAKFLGIPMGKKAQEFLGIRDPNLYKAREGGVREGANKLRNDLDALRGMSENDKFIKGVDDLQRANDNTYLGDIAGSKESISKVNKLLGTKTLSRNEEEVLNQVKYNIQTLNKVQGTTSKIGEGNLLMDLIQSPSLRVGLGSGALSGFSSGEEGSGFNTTAALVGLVGGTAGRKTLGKMSQVGIDRKLASVRKALGGKYKVDATAREMIENGVDEAKVIAYLVLRAQIGMDE